MMKKNAKYMIWQKKSFKQPVTNGKKCRINTLILLIKRCRKNEAKAYINNVDEEILGYSRVFSKHIKPLPTESQLPDLLSIRRPEKWGTIV